MYRISWWPRAEILALIGIIFTAVGSIAAIIAILPENVPHQTGSPTEGGAFGPSASLAPAEEVERTVTVAGEPLRAATPSDPAVKVGGCVRPEHGGELVRGSGNFEMSRTNAPAVFNGTPAKLGDPPLRPSDPSPWYNAGWWVTEDRPQQICIQIFARISDATKGTIYYEGRATAMERYRMGAVIRQRMQQGSAFWRLDVNFPPYRTPRELVVAPSLTS